MRQWVFVGGKVAKVALRGVALYVAAFSLIAIVGELRGRSSDLNVWWIDLHDLPDAVRMALLATFAALLATWALSGGGGARRGQATALGCLAFATLALRDTVGFYTAIAAGSVHPTVWLPLSLLIAVLLVTLALVAARPAGQPVAPARTASSRSARIRDLAVVASAAGAWACIFPLAQILFFGTSDYRRPADAAVVFGARVYANGQPSPLLADRIRTGVELYQVGLVPLLVMSGGDGADGFNEASVMRDVAVSAGVDPRDVIVDPAGNSTEATVSNSISMLATRDDTRLPSRLIAVSQAYHLPRVQLAFANAGIDVFTVPAAEREPISEMPILILREVPAFWLYYLRVCLG